VPRAATSWQARRRARRTAWTLAALAVVAAVVIPLVSVVSSGVETVKRVSPVIHGLTIPTVPTVPGASTGQDGGVPGDLVSRRGFRVALRRLGRLQGAGPVRLLRVDPGALSAQMSGRRGLAIARVSAASSQVITTTTPSPGRTIPLRAIDRDAPARIVAALGQRHLRLDYAVLSSILGPPGWVAYATSGAHFGADAHGRGLKRLG
jgi:hypothetical protein